MHDEDEHALQCVEDGEDPRKDNGCAVDDEQAKHPCQAQQWQQDERGFDGAPATDTMIMCAHIHDSGYPCYRAVWPRP